MSLSVCCRSSSADMDHVLSTVFKLFAFTFIVSTRDW